MAFSVHSISVHSFTVSIPTFSIPFIKLVKICDAADIKKKKILFLIELFETTGVKS